MTTKTLTLSVEEAGRLLGVGRDASYRAAQNGDIPTVRIGRKLRVPIGSLSELLGTTPDQLGVETLERWALIKELIGTPADYQQCGGTNSSGEQCRCHVVAGIDRCHWHRDA